MYESYSEAWNRAITDREDFNDVISIIHDAYLDNGAIDQIERQKEDIENILKDLNALPDNLPEAHKKTIELFGIYSQLNSLAIAPSGSLMSYNNKFNELQSSLISKLNEIKVTLPQNEKINETVSNFIKKYNSNETQVNNSSKLKIIKEGLFELDNFYFVKGNVYNQSDKAAKNVVIKYYIWKKYMGQEGHGLVIKDTGGLVVSTISYIPPQRIIEFTASSQFAPVMTIESGLVPDPLNAEITAEWDE